MKTNLMILFILFSVFLLSCPESYDPFSDPDSEEANGTNTTYSAPPATVYIYSVTTTPTESEKVVLKNNSGFTVDISDYVLGDLNDPDAYPIPDSTILLDQEYITFVHTQLPFGINDSGERIYLWNGSGAKVDQWPNYYQK